MSEQRQIFLHGPLGRRQFKEVLGSVMAALLLTPDVIWLVSPWLSDFVLLDNTAGQWDALNPSWGGRELSFNELLADALNAGCSIRIVTRNDAPSRRFIQHLDNRRDSTSDLKFLLSDEVHTKGFLTKECFFKGSMNFTYSGTHRNDEHIMLTQDPSVISDAFLEFESRYQFPERV